MNVILGLFGLDGVVVVVVDVVVVVRVLNSPCSYLFSVYFYVYI